MNNNSIETEGFGLDYERYILQKTIAHIVEKYNIENVLELPASGVKAMPSIYSLGFGLAGCNVTLVNGVEQSLYAWQNLGIRNNVSIVKCDNLEKTGLKESSYDLVWSFAIFSTLKNHKNILQEMVRISRKYISIFSVNAHNPGYLSHRLAHFITKTPWSHGDTYFYRPKNVKKFFQDQHVKVLDIGFIDTPPWPDSIGFRDIRLHKLNMNLSNIQWHSRYVDYISNNQLPAWIKLIYIFEKLPMANIIKKYYAHLFYVIGKI